MISIKTMLADDPGRSFGLSMPGRPANRLSVRLLFPDVCQADTGYKKLARALRAVMETIRMMLMVVGLALFFLIHLIPTSPDVRGTLAGPYDIHIASGLQER